MIGVARDKNFFRFSGPDEGKNRFLQAGVIVESEMDGDLSVGKSAAFLSYLNGLFSAVVFGMKVRTGNINHMVVQGTKRMSMVVAFKKRRGFLMGIMSPDTFHRHA